MAIEDKNTLAPARDEFERYYSEKIWEWIPTVYKDEDGLATNPHVLRAIVKILACQAAIGRRSIDRLWEDQFIELCDDWAIPYIGDLVGTRLVNELNRRGRRTDVARTIFYRRRKGTLPVLELLIRDITGWQGVAAESFKRLARTRHGLDAEPGELEGLITETPPGGWANLKSVRGGELVHGPFDEFAHTPDFRQLRGKLGRYNISKLNFHLYRQLPFEVNFATPAKFGDGRFTFDPSGRDIALFRPDQRPDPPEWNPPREWELPAPIPCRLLNSAQYRITAGVIDDLIANGLSQPAADELAVYSGVLFRNETRLRETVESLNTACEILEQFSTLLAQALTETSPKAYLIPTNIQPDSSAIAVAKGDHKESLPVEHQAIIAGNLGDWGASLGELASEKELVIDPENGRFWFLTAPTEDEKVWVPVYHYGFPANIGAGSYDRRETIKKKDEPFPMKDEPILSDGDSNPGPVSVEVPPPPLKGVYEIADSKTYRLKGDIIGIDNVTFQAGNFERPYVKRIVAADNERVEWVFSAQPKTGDESRCLNLDGLWIGIEQKDAVPMSLPCAPVVASLVLQGGFDRVVIRHCTLDPGGEKAQLVPDQCQAIPYIQLLVRGNVKELVIESSIVGPILEDRVPGDPGKIQKLVIRDSIVHSIDPTTAALDTDLGHVTLKRVTVFGNVSVNRLYASEALIQGVVTVTDNQHGCFRFSAANDVPQTRLPQQYESHLFELLIPNHFFISRRFGEAGYAQLSTTVPESILRGAENGSEMGAFSNLLNPIKRDDLKAKVNEFMPFGLIAQYINET